MTGLRLMNELSDPGKRDAVLSRTPSAVASLSKKPRRNRCPPLATQRSPKVRTDIPIPAVAYLDRKARTVPDLNDVWSYINPYMLFGRHLGFRGNFEKALGERDPRALELFNDMEETKREARSFMKIGAVWQFFEAERQGNSIALFAPGACFAAAHFPFPASACGRSSLPERLHSSGERGPARSSGAVCGHRRGGNSREIRRSKSRAENICIRTDCRLWHWKPPKLAPNGCIAASAKIGDSPIRRQ